MTFFSDNNFSREGQKTNDVFLLFGEEKMPLLHRCNRALASLSAQSNCFSLRTLQTHTLHYSVHTSISSHNTRLHPKHTHAELSITTRARLLRKNKTTKKNVYESSSLHVTSGRLAFHPVYPQSRPLPHAPRAPLPKRRRRRGTIPASVQLNRGLCCERHV